MTYSVDCSDITDDELALAWLMAPDRPAVTDAADRIHRLLSRNPRQAGTEVSEGLWKIEVPPLAAYYTIDDAATEVMVDGFTLLP